ncbi:hypothetical protein PE066_00710 [Ramlibacter tataouinensis]|uniref:hypothetical protein n=1 Tax=Ramlibacter tataouinensis TaxID=94132 RepID=UPI0022F3A9B6|nr:hypothetical protein [Ramlibacter tataouinensis]WBY02093.1 hypothetical protein PE066_00710 [Ramlibacter tataouinensis]
MSSIPTYVYPFMLAIVAAVAGRLLGGPPSEKSFPGWILYAVAIACVIIGFATMWLDQAA